MYLYILIHQLTYDCFGQAKTRIKMFYNNWDNTKIYIIIKNLVDIIKSLNFLVQFLRYLSIAKYVMLLFLIRDLTIPMCKHCYDHADAPDDMLCYAMYNCYKNGK